MADCVCCLLQYPIEITFINDVWGQLNKRRMEPPHKKVKPNEKPHFVLYSDEELQRKHDASKNINTTRSEERANSVFQKFLQQAGKKDLNYWYYDEPELDQMLEKFWFGARKDINLDTYNEAGDCETEDSFYSANTMKNIRYSLNRILKNKGHLYDIINTSNMSFKHSQKAFFTSQKDLKERGKGQIYSAPEITETGTIASISNCDQTKTKTETKQKQKQQI